MALDNVPGQLRRKRKNVMKMKRLDLMALENAPGQLRINRKKIAPPGRLGHLDFVPPDSATRVMIRDELPEPRIFPCRPYLRLGALRST